MIGREHNVCITEGDPIPVPDDVEEWNYVHTRLSFGDVDILEVTEMPDMSSVEAVRDLFKGRNAVIYMERIGDDIEAGVNTSVMKVISDSTEAERYKSLPSGYKTSNGSIIPHPIIPDKNYRYADNGLKFDDNEGHLPREGGYVWNAENMNSTGSIDGSNENAVKEAGEAECYGVRNFKMYVENTDANGTYVDDPILAVRKYRCNLSPSIISIGGNADGFSVATAGKGSFALCHMIKQASDIDEDTVDAKGNGNLSPPFLKFDIGARKRGDVSMILDEYQNFVENNSKGIKITILDGGESEIRIGVDKEMGTFCAMENDILPPQCFKNEDGEMTMNVMYIYPTYYGLVARNSIVSDPKKQGISEVLVKDSFKGVKSPWNSLTVLDGSGNAAYRDYALQYLKNNPGSDLEFFPSVLHETADPLSIRLQVHNDESITFNSSISATWSRCLGRWAYCPLYFHRNLRFTLYFKGSYPGEGQSDNFVYYLYPLVGVYSDEGSKWTGVTYNAGDCVVATRVIVDHDRLEAIYKADFQFKSEEMLRFPVEVFGAEIVLARKEFQFSHKSGNGKFRLCETNGSEGTGAQIREQYSYAKFLQGYRNLHLGLITSVSVTSSMDGVDGSMELDGYPIEQGIAVLHQMQSIGELDLAAYFPDDDPLNPDDIYDINPNPTIFCGYGLEIGTTGSDGDYHMSVKLEGVQRKMNDMKLVCAPFWDGDRLEAICLYFEQYMKLKLKMIDHTVTKFSDAKPVSDNMFAQSGNWVSDIAYTMRADNNGVNDNAFRVPRSFNWMSPAVNFQTGTSCMEALKRLAEFTSCVFCIGIDGVGYFYELNEYGIPYYVQNQVDFGSYVEFDSGDIVNVSLSPTFENRYNSIATFGFIKKFTKEAALEPESKDAVTPGINYTMSSGNDLFPWSRHNVGVENGFLTKDQLKMVHDVRVKFSKADRYQGTITVLGNTRVTHMYQVIKIFDIYYYVLQISHSLDLSRKQWTTSYQIGYFNPGSIDGDTQYGRL